MQIESKIRNLRSKDSRKIIPSNMSKEEQMLKKLADKNPAILSLVDRFGLKVARASSM